MRLEFFVPIRTGTGLNERLHWAARAKKVKWERAATALAFRSAINGIRRTTKGLGSPPFHVLLTRVKPRGKKLDDDNIRGSLKAVRDAIASELKLDDGSDSIRFEYAQDIGPWGVRVRVVDADYKQWEANCHGQAKPTG